MPNKNSKEPRFFNVEWAQSREAKLAVVFGNTQEGLEFLIPLLNASYHTKGKNFHVTPLKDTEETLAKSKLSQVLGTQRSDLICIYPHPKDKNTILVQTDNGEYFEVDKQGHYKRKTIDARSPILEFWEGNDDVVFDDDIDEQSFYL